MPTERGIAGGAKHRGPNPENETPFERNDYTNEKDSRYDLSGIGIMIACECSSSEKQRDRLMKFVLNVHLSWIATELSYAITDAVVIYKMAITGLCTTPPDHMYHPARRMYVPLSEMWKTQSHHDYCTVQGSKNLLAYPAASHPHIRSPTSGEF
ncbi:hypothetical protein AVEN_188075-1 [Araneus ventricosus]|uniref:Uncharacterized protein n=1 Tax=Araneus ventricosus TaxID=182803 RepID=A0A4Y2IDS1_ARAVE|nr:hypothetical protein AVEN_188075-1 [Araneus ventricosus]